MLQGQAYCESERASVAVLRELALAPASDNSLRQHSLYLMRAELRLKLVAETISAAKVSHVYCNISAVETCNYLDACIPCRRNVEYNC